MAPTLRATDRREIGSDPLPGSRGVEWEHEKKRPVTAKSAGRHDRRGDRHWSAGTRRVVVRERRNLARSGCADTDGGLGAGHPRRADHGRADHHDRSPDAADV